MGGEDLMINDSEFFLDVLELEVNKACRTEQMCRGVGSGIKVGIQVMWLLWKQHTQKEYWGFLLFNSHQSFNEENQTYMI